MAFIILDDATVSKAYEFENIKRISENIFQCEYYVRDMFELAYPQLNQRSTLVTLTDEMLHRIDEKILFDYDINNMDVYHKYAISAYVRYKNDPELAKKHLRVLAEFSSRMAEKRYIKPNTMSFDIAQTYDMSTSIKEFIKSNVLLHDIDYVYDYFIGNRQYKFYAITELNRLGYGTFPITNTIPDFVEEIYKIESGQQPFVLREYFTKRGTLISENEIQYILCKLDLTICLVALQDVDKNLYKHAIPLIIRRAGNSALTTMVRETNLDRFMTRIDEPYNLSIIKEVQTNKTNRAVYLSYIKMRTTNGLFPDYDKNTLYELIVEGMIPIGGLLLVVKSFLSKEKPDFNGYYRILRSLLVCNNPNVNYREYIEMIVDKAKIELMREVDVPEKFHKVNKYIIDVVN